MVIEPGMRIELDHTSDPYTHLRPGDRGTVVLLDGVGTIHVAWDGGSRLGLVTSVDRWHYVEKEA